MLTLHKGGENMIINAKPIAMPVVNANPGTRLYACE